MPPGANSARRIFSRLLTRSSHWSAIVAVSLEFTISRPVSKLGDGGNSPMLDVRGLTKKYRNRAVVDHVTFSVPPGR